MSNPHYLFYQGGDYNLFLTNLTNEDQLQLANAENVTEVLPLGFGLSNDPETLRIIHFTTALFLVIVGVLGTLGNGLVLYIFTR